MLDFPTLPVTAKTVPRYRLRATAAIAATASLTDGTINRGSSRIPRNYRQPKARMHAAARLRTSEGPPPSGKT